MASTLCETWPKTSRKTSERASERSKVQQAVMDDDFKAERRSRR
jgi:hypothetical protein